MLAQFCRKISSGALAVSTTLPLGQRFPETELSTTHKLEDEVREGTSTPTGVPHNYIVVVACETQNYFFLNIAFSEMRLIVHRISSVFVHHEKHVL